MTDSYKRNNDLLHLIDFTYLNDNENDNESFDIFVKQATSIEVACLCIYPHLLKKTHQLCPAHKLATVVNFPLGDERIEKIKQDLELAQIADEIDIVFPYALFLSGKKQQAFDKMQEILSLIPAKKCIKVIIESGLYSNDKDLIEVCQFLLHQPIHFIKTSTGKIPQGASLNAAKIILNAIKGSNLGLKVSGGIRTTNDAKKYIDLTEKIFNQKVKAKNFRIGASQLVAEILNSEK